VLGPEPAATTAEVAAPWPLLVRDLRLCRVPAGAVLAVAASVMADSAARMTALSSWLAMYRAQTVNWL